MLLRGGETPFFFFVVLGSRGPDAGPHVNRLKQRRFRELSLRWLGLPGSEICATIPKLPRDFRRWMPKSEARLPPESEMCDPAVLSARFCTLQWPGGRDCAR